ncbi:MAG TPA: glycosyltransferase family 2 protein [Pirellulaceae bacterium]|nr:glycosyltransferase family 2 protein [Pirellulaceae bacterium]
MLVSSLSGLAPSVSIILPTYNRAKFLPQAFDSIRAQEWTDWELIVVDDGSTDDTRALVHNQSQDVTQPVRYVYQHNQGPAEARNRGLALASGKYVAFFDSDDVWLPHHLATLADALDANQELDWVFAGGRRIDLKTGHVVIDNTIYSEKPRPRFLRLKTTRVGALRIINDPAIRRCGFRGSGFGGMQCTMARREVFSRLRFEPVAFFEDRIILMRAVAAGVRFGYFDTVTVLVYTHDENVSFANPEVMRNRLRAFRLYVDALEVLRAELPQTWAERQALNARLGQEYFWSLGYTLFQQGNVKEALPLMRRAIRLCPSNMAFLKTYMASIAKVYLGCAPHPSTPVVPPTPL